MATDWSNPLVNTLTTADALALQQIFRSLSIELARINSELENIRNSTGTTTPVDKGKLR